MIFAHMEGDETRRLELQRNGDTYRVLDEGEEIITVDARGVSPDRWSILVGSRSYEAKVTRDKTVYQVEIDGRTKIAICGQISDYIPNPTFEVVARPGAYHRHQGSGKTRRELGRADGPIQCPDEFRDRDGRLGS